MDSADPSTLGALSRTPGFNQFDAAYDLPYSGTPKINYAICATQRSGSHYLGHLLYSTGKLGYPLEYLHPPHLARWSQLADTASVSEVLRYIKGRRTSANGCFGMKLHYKLMELAYSRYSFDEMFPECKFVLIERGDLLGQAISFVRADQSGQWISMHAATGVAAYDRDAILGAMHFLVAARASWEKFFAVTGKPFHRVRYEQLDADPIGEVDAVARFIGVGRVTINWDLVLPKRQAGAESEQWRERFLGDIRSLPAEQWAASLSIAEKDVSIHLDS